jgi:tryptophan synthase alpha chain
MPKNRIDDCFGNRVNPERVALLPYFTAGFPNCDVALELISRDDVLGAPVVEIGVPYSDSIADGPVIQSSFYRTLAVGHQLADTFAMVSRVRPVVGCALVAMVSYSIVHRAGAQQFMTRAASAGFDGVILPDVPVEESGPIAELAGRAGLCHIGLVAPTTSAARRRLIAKGSSGFIYQIAVAGPTGERTDLPPALHGQVAELKQISGLPVCVGFGISRPEHVWALNGLADGAIVGSAIIRRIATALEQGTPSACVVEEISQFLSQLITGPTHAGPRQS